MQSVDYLKIRRFGDIGSVGLSQARLDEPGIEGFNRHRTELAAYVGGQFFEGSLPFKRRALTVVRSHIIEGVRYT